MSAGDYQMDLDDNQMNLEQQPGNGSGVSRTVTVAYVDRATVSGSIVGYTFCVKRGQRRCHRRNFFKLQDFVLKLKYPNSQRVFRGRINAIVKQVLKLDIIVEIEKVTVTAAQAEEKLECSVCCEYFLLDERARKMSCGHIYHENCIAQWMEINGTCPMCRKSTKEQRQAYANRATNILRRAAGMFFFPDGSSGRASGAEMSAIPRRQTRSLTRQQAQQQQQPEL